MRHAFFFFYFRVFRVVDQRVESHARDATYYVVSFCPWLNNANPYFYLTSLLTTLVCFSSSPIGLLYLKIALFDQVELSSFQVEILEVKEEKKWICIQGSCLFILISMVLTQSQCTLDKPLYARIFTYDSLHKRSL